MDEFILDPAFANENPDFWALNDLQIFDINRQMYDFDEVATATKRIQRLYEKRPNPMDSVHSPSQIRDMFRFYPEQIVQLCELLEEDLKPRTKRNNSISVVTHVCTALHYFGTGKHCRSS